MKGLKPHQNALVFAGIASLAIWAVPLLAKMTLPLVYLNTHLHELCHALMALAMGGNVQMIHVDQSGSGYTPVSAPDGLASILVVSAGYVGATLIGAGMIYFGRQAKGARLAIYTVCMALAISMVLWVRSDTVGVVSGIFWVGALAVFGKWLPDNAIVFAAQFLGLQQCLNAANSLYTLLQISAFSDTHSDASIMATYTGLPPIVWAVVWCGFSFAMVGLTLRRAWGPETARAGLPKQGR